MIRDFVPCINPDGIAGFYDVVQQRFYGSANNKAFTAAATDLTGKELVSDSDFLNRAGSSDIIRNRDYYLVSRTIPAEIRKGCHLWIWESVLMPTQQSKVVVFSGRMDYALMLYFPMRTDIYILIT